MSCCSEDFGVHLGILNDIPMYRWLAGKYPCSSRNKEVLCWWFVEEIKENEERNKEKI
jgi:hypothetical protein